jgi:hypothetical protein
MHCHNWCWTYAQGLRKMRENAGVGGLLANAALREHHKILQAALQLEDWSRSEALFLQVDPLVTLCLCSIFRPSFGRLIEHFAPLQSS